MELTPIRVRGKRPRPGEPKRPVGRPPKKQRLIVPVERKRHEERRRPLSLEQILPLEVLERIFLMSENINFARCSRRIGACLSSRSLLLETLVAAFAPTWDNWFGCVSSEVSSYKGYITSDASRFGGNPEFQV